MREERHRETYDDTVRKVTYNASQRAEIFRSLSVSARAKVLTELSLHVKRDLVSRLKNDELITVLDELDLQSATRLITCALRPKRRKKILKRMKSELKEKSEYFLRFHPQATLSLLNFNYLFLPGSITIGDAAEQIDEFYNEVGKLPEVLVEEGGALAGSVSPSALIRSSNASKLKTHMERVVTVSYKAEVPEVVDILTNNTHKKAIVLDSDGSVIGVVYADDVIALFDQAPGSSLYDFAGVSDTERIFDGVLSKVGHRWRWLVVNLATAFLAAFVVSLFEETLAQLVILAVYMPIVAGMGGNAATQTLAVFVRGIALGEVTLRRGLPAIAKEIGAGLLNGVITGVIVAVVVVLFNGDPLLGVVLAGAMAFNLVVAGFFGAVVPLLMKRLGRDPATSATIFITTATDVFGFLFFLGAASLFLL